MYYSYKNYGKNYTGLKVASILSIIRWGIFFFFWNFNKCYLHSQTINFNTVIIQQSEVTKSAQAEELKNVCLKGRLKHPHALFPGFPNCAHCFWRLSFAILRIPFNWVGEMHLCFCSLYNQFPSKVLWREKTFLLSWLLNRSKQLKNAD